VAWPKKASGMKTDVTEDVLRQVILPHGLDRKVCAIDETWSGLLFSWQEGGLLTVFALSAESAASETGESTSAQPVLPPFPDVADMSCSPPGSVQTEPDGP
jgi:hypothetical protein